MQEWVDVSPVTEFLPDTCRTVAVAGLSVVVFNLDGHFYGLEDCCTHDGGELSSGQIDAGKIVCPRHAAQFDIKTGAVLTPPAYEDIPTVSVRLHEGMVQVR
ncbi:MAG: Rieske 2Fe-2S domain-containing protein [Magnetococcus sp. XQGC-1]